MTLRDLTDRFWNLFEEGRFDELEAFVAPDCHFAMPGMEFRGKEPLLAMLKAYRIAFPDLRHSVTHHVESADTIALELDVAGTHTGPMMTLKGEVAATGKRITWRSCDYIRVSKGAVTSWHVYHDPTPFLAALGLIPGG